MRIFSIHGPVCILNLIKLVLMPFPLGIRCIVISGCPLFLHLAIANIDPSVYMSIPLILWPSIREVSRHYLNNTWREWPYIWHADVSHPPKKLWDCSHCLSIFLIWTQFWGSETCRFWGFWAFSREYMEGVASNLACWCNLSTFRSGLILVMIGRFT